MKSWISNHPIAVLTLLSALMFLPGLSSLPPLDRDESRFVQATTQMLETQNFLLPFYQETPRSKKPVGIYWLQSASTETLSEAPWRQIWTYRLPSAIAAWLAVLLTFAIGRELFDRKTAFLAGGLLALTLLVAVEARIAKTDATLLATTLLAMWGLTRAYAKDLKGASAGPLAFVAFWGGLGLATLIKGPIGPAVVALTLIGLWIGRGHLRYLKALNPAWGILLLLAVIAPWPLALYASGELSFIIEAAKEDLLPKLTGGQEGHGAPMGFYFLTSYLTLWPISLLALPALAWNWRNRLDANVGFLLAWIIPSWLMFEWVPTKLVHYILPVFPALVLLVANSARQGLPVLTYKWAYRAQVFFWGLISVALSAGFTIAAILFNSPLWIALPLTVIVGIGAIIGLRGAWQRNIQQMLVAFCVLSGGALPWMASAYAPSLTYFWVSPRIAEALPADTSVLAATGFHEPSLVFLTDTQTKLVSPEEVALTLSQDPFAVGLVERRKLKKFNEKAQELGLEVVVLDEMRGQNLANGRDMTLHLLRAK